MSKPFLSRRLSRAVAEAVQTIVNGSIPEQFGGRCMYYTHVGAAVLSVVIEDPAVEVGWGYGGCRVRVNRPWPPFQGWRDLGYTDDDLFVGRFHSWVILSRSAQDPRFEVVDLGIDMFRRRPRLTDPSFTWLPRLIWEEARCGMHEGMLYMDVLGGRVGYRHDPGRRSLIHAWLNDNGELVEALANRTLELLEERNVLDKPGIRVQLPSV